MTIEELAEKAAFEIWNDLTDRRGVGDELQNCDEDIQEEIKRMMVRSIALAIESHARKMGEAG